MAGDAGAKGFLMGATAGRTTLNGEGLQHEDGHGLLLASTVPNCRAYDPAFAYELAVIVQRGLERMYHDNEEVFYYITLMTENYPHPEMPQGVEDGIEKGIYLFKQGKPSELRVQLMGSGAILREVIAGAQILQDQFGVVADIWSVPGVNQLHREAMAVDRFNMLHPEEEPREQYVEKVLEGHNGPVILSTDYISAYGEQLRRLIPNSLTILGTDGYGRSDTRAQLRSFFEIDRYHVVVAALQALAKEGKLERSVVKQALDQFEINTETSHPMTR